MRSPLRAARVVVAVLLGLLALTATATGASAHARLVETLPVDGATVGALPAPVTLTFSDPLDPVFVRVRATGPAGAVAEPSVATKGGTVEVGLPDQGPGAYEVVYRVVSKDGHPVSGRVAFTVAGPATEGAGSFAPATPTATGPATTGPASPPQSAPGTPGPGATVVSTATLEDTGRDGSGVPVAYLAGVALGVLALGAAAWAAVARRGR